MVSAPAPPTWPDTRARTPQVRPRGQWKVGPTLHDASSNPPEIPVRGAAGWLRHCFLKAVVGPHPQLQLEGSGRRDHLQKFPWDLRWEPLLVTCGEKHSGGRAQVGTMAVASSELCRLFLRALCELTPGPEEDAQAGGQVPAGSPPGSIPVPRPLVPCPVWDAETPA